MSQILTLSGRPQTFDDLVGQKHMVELIRRHMSKRPPSAWMFIGESGAGKTTVARILATSLQCKHQSEFGSPCDPCRKGRAKFDVVEVNAAEASGVSEVESVITGAYYTPKPPSQYRVYIFDECQNLSKAAQSCLLKYTEDSPKSTVWIFCTTAPGSILRTLRRRCLTYTIPSLGMKGVEALVKRTIEHAKEKKTSEPLVEALLEAGVTSPGFIVLAVEKYLAGESPEKAAQVGLDSSLDTLRVCRAVVKGDWESVRQALFAANPEDGRALRASMGGYLKSMLLDQPQGKTARIVAEGIKELGQLNSFEDGLQLASTISALYRLCNHFSNR